MKIYKVFSKRYTENFYELEPIGYYSTRQSAVDFMHGYLDGKGVVRGEFVCLELEELEIDEDRIQNIVEHLNSATAEQWNQLSSESHRSCDFEIDSVRTNPAIMREIEKREKQRAETQ